MRRLTDRMFTIAAAAAAGGAAIVLLVLIGVVAARGLSVVSFEFLTAGSSEAGAGGGILYHVVGTLILILTAASIAIPIAAGTAIFSYTYAGFGAQRWLDALLQALNAVPSIVFGIFGLVVFVRLAGMRKSWLAGGIILAMMIIPTITVAFLERLRSISLETMEASAALGLTRGQIVRTVLVPHGASALLTGALLGLARAAGETAPIMFTAVIFSGATIPRGIVDSPVLALPYHIFVLAQDSFAAGAEERMWGAAAVLLAIVGTLSLISLPLRMRIHEEAGRD